MNDSDITAAKALYKRGEDAYAAGEYTRALEIFAEFMLHPGADDDTRKPMHWNMALCQAHLGNLRAAVEHAELAGTTEAELLKVLEQQGVSLDPQEQDARRLYYEGQADVANGRYDKAVETFVELFVHPGIKNDQHSAMHHNVALCLAHLGEWDKAMGHAKQAGFDDASFTAFMAERGVHGGDTSELEARRLYAEAEAAFDAGQTEKCLDLNAELAFHPGTTAAMLPALHWNMAMCHAKLGDWDKAEDQLHAGGHNVGAFEADMEMRGIYRTQA